MPEVGGGEDRRKQVPIGCSPFGRSDFALPKQAGAVVAMHFCLDTSWFVREKGKKGGAAAPQGLELQARTGAGTETVPYEAALESMWAGLACSACTTSSVRADGTAIACG